MGKKNDAIVPFFKDKSRFSDLFNGALFNGEQLIKPEELELVDGDTGVLLRDNQIKVHKVNRFRDIRMKWRNSVTLTFLACEIQENVNYAMPVRGMIYDGLAYAEQIEELWNALDDGEKRNVNSAEFLSHFRKKDSIVPVITLVFYCGDEWDGSLDLHSMFKGSKKRKNFGCDTELIEKYVPNYKINLINPIKMKDLSVFKSDLQLIFGMLKYKDDKNRLFRFTKDNRSYFESINCQTAYAIAMLLDDNRLLDIFLGRDEKEEKNMCKALDDLYNDGVAEGKIEGERRGRILGSVEAYKSMNCNNETIIKKLIEIYSISNDEAKEFVF